MNLDLGHIVILEGIIKWAGVAIGVAGVVLSSPDGTKQLARAIWTSIKKRFRRQRQEASASASFSGTGTIGISSAVKAELGWTDNTSLDRRIDILKSLIDGLNQRLSDAELKIGSRLDGHDELIRRLRADLESAEQSLHKRIDTNEEKAARIDAMGLPVIGLGIFLSGVPGELASVPPLGVGLTIASVLVTGFVFRLTIKSGAWREGQSISVR